MFRMILQQSEILLFLRVKFKFSWSWPSFVTRKKFRVFAGKF